MEKTASKRSGATRFFKPQGNSIIPKRKFVTTFQKRRARRGAKAVNKKRRDRVYAGRGKWCKVKVGRLSGGAGVGRRLLHALSAALSLRSVRRRFAAIFRRRVFAYKAFSLSGICARRN